MEWVIIFVVSWLLFFLLVDWKELKTNLWCGIVAVALQLAIDTQAMNHGWYKINRGVLWVFGSSAFFVMGPVLVIGIFMAQFHPTKRWMRVINVIVLSSFYSIFELLVLARKVLVYIDWHYTESLIINTCAMAILSWFTIVVLDKKGESS
jgi:hypothetical protein